MAYTTITKSSSFMNPKIWTGSGSPPQSVTGIGFQPDLVWWKPRGNTDDWSCYDAVRGVENRIKPNSNAAQSVQDTGLTAFNADGYTVGSHVGTADIASWNWKANGAGSANTDGSINSTVSVNTTAGFSIVSYTGTGSNATIGHGLGSVPAWIITKNRDATQPWRIYQKGVDASAPEDYGLILNDTSARDNDNTAWNDTAPTSSVFSVGSSANTNNGSDDFIAYCFAEKTGYSKFGSYPGNDNADGTFVYTGFKPAVVILKCSSHASTPWTIWDNKRPGYNVTNLRLRPSTNAAEDTSTADPIDLLSNGFKCRGTNDDTNKSGNTYIYMAFGQTLVGTNNIPATAR